VAGQLQGDGGSLDLLRVRFLQEKGLEVVRMVGRVYGELRVPTAMVSLSLCQTRNGKQG
jgi:hypothetical protein